MEKVTFINGSPRGKESASQYFIDEISKLLNGDQYEVNKKVLNNGVNFGEITNSDILVIAFPLYVDCLPSAVIEFLTNLEQYAGNSKKSTRVYAVVNCGFYEGIQNKHAVQIIKNFCNKVGYKWRFGLGIGCGEFLRETKANIPLKSRIKLKVYKAMVEVQKDIITRADDGKESIFVSPGFPKFLYMVAGNRSWISGAKVKGTSKKQLYAKPFAGNN